MSAATLKAFVRMSADETISLLQSEGVKPDPVLPPLIKILDEGQVTESLDEFTTDILSEKETKFKPFGEKVTEFDVHPKEGGGMFNLIKIVRFDQFSSYRTVSTIANSTLISNTPIT